MWAHGIPAPMFSSCGMSIRERQVFGKTAIETNHFPSCSIASNGAEISVRQTGLIIRSNNRRLCRTQAPRRRAVFLDKCKGLVDGMERHPLESALVPLLFGLLLSRRTR